MKKSQYARELRGKIARELFIFYQELVNDSEVSELVILRDINSLIQEIDVSMNDIIINTIQMNGESKKE